MIKFIKGMFSSGSDVSSKRVFGGLGFVTGLAFVGVFDHTMINTVIYVSAALLGLGIIDKIGGTK